MVWVSTCTVASAQSTSSPSIQIFSVGVMGMGLQPFCDGVAHGGGGERFGGGGRRGHGVGLGAERLEDARRGIVLTEMLEHERGGVDGGERIGDALARDVVGRSVHGLEEG